MARIEKEGEVKEQLESMRGEMLKTVRQAGRPRRPWLTCGIVLLLAFALVAFAAAWVLAATGLVNIPGVSSAAYEAPTPVHPVAPGEPLDVFVSRALNDTLSRRLAESGGLLDDRRITIDIPESSFTASIRAALSQTDQTVFDPGTAQAAVIPEGLELFLPFKDNPQGSALTLVLAFEAKEGVLDPVVRSVRVGALRLPAPLVQAAIVPAVQQSLAPFAQELGRYASVREVAYPSGFMRVEADLTVEVLQINR